MKDFFQKNMLWVIGILVGAVAGYLYYHFIGCNSGTCKITSKPLNSSLYGAVMGGLFFNLFKKTKSTDKIQNESKEEIKMP